jgi:phosphate transport system substrate-binding protein
MKTIWILPLLAGLVLAGCSSDGGGTAGTSGAPGTTGTPGANGASATLNGAGSSFVNPAMQKWAYQYHADNSGVSINYQSVGSGAGIAQLQAGTVDFACSDVAMSDKEIGEMSGPVAQFPLIAGCVAVAYNVPGVQNGLKLSGDVIADIFLGKIKKWNDPRIAGQNPGMTLPDTAISVAHRSDGSGTTYIFTDYLSAVSPEWNSKVGKGKSVEWPVGVGGKGSEGVSGVIKQSPGTIGYVELAYALETKMNYGPIKNKSGNYVDPTLESTSAAANAAADALKADIRTSIVDSSAADAYPIAGFTYAIMPKNPKDAAKSEALVAYLKWVLGPGQDMAKELHYAPLPATVAGVNEGILAEVKPQ